MTEEKKPASETQSNDRVTEGAGPEGLASSRVPDLVEYALIALSHRPSRRPGGASARFKQYRAITTCYDKRINKIHLAPSLAIFH